MAMANSKGSSNIGNFIYPGKLSLLPPKSPFPSVSSAYVDCFVPPLNGLKVVQKPRNVHPLHQRTSSESFLVEEQQPSWLDDLLNEPENPVRRGGHRRSSSDSFACLGVGSFYSQDYLTQEEYKPRNMSPAPSWGSQDFNQYQEGCSGLLGDPKILNMAHSSGLASSRNDFASQTSGISFAPQGAGLDAKQKQDQVEARCFDSNASYDNKETSQAKPSGSETDTKRAKQQFAQRSRVRKLQYIAELERNVQVLQAEGSGVTAELEFLNQQNLILSMENKALKHRLDGLAQEHMIKHIEQEVLEREIGRLRALYQQQLQKQHQQQPQQQKKPSPSHRRSTSKDLDSQFANLTLKQKGQSPSLDNASFFLDRVS